MKKILIVLLLATTLVGCGSRFVYNNLDWLVHWYIDDYIDLNKPQKREFDVMLEQWLVWHRQEELQQYQTQLKQIRAQVQAGEWSVDNIQAHRRQIEAHWKRAIRRIAPELLTLVPSLTDKQIAQMFKAAEKQNQEFEEDYLDLDSEERLEHNLKRTKKALKPWFGRLTDEQEALVIQTYREAKRNFEPWLEYRRHAQQETRQLLEQRHDRDDVPDTLLAWMLDPAPLYNQTFADNMAFNDALYIDMVAQLGRTLTPKQQKKALAKLDDYIEDLQELMDED